MQTKNALCPYVHAFIQGFYRAFGNQLLIRSSIMNSIDIW